jgi:DNA mismatch endonuclease (patch repair protein)
MADTLTKTERSRQMALVRGKNNKSTEGKVEGTLTAHRISGWEKHPRQVLGQPDFYFVEDRLALFVDGCFWHACPKCGRLPKTRVDFWTAKISGNRRRDNRTTRQLRKQGIHVLRIWEHELRGEEWVRRVKRLLTIARSTREPTTKLLTR